MFGRHPAVDLVAHVVPDVPRSGGFLEMGQHVGAGQHRLGLDRLQLTGEELAGHHPAQVVLQADAVDHLDGPPLQADLHLAPIGPAFQLEGNRAAQDPDSGLLMGGPVLRREEHLPNPAGLLARLLHGDVLRGAHGDRRSAPMDQDPDLGPGPDVHGSGQGNRVGGQVGLPRTRPPQNQQSQDDRHQGAPRRPRAKRKRQEPILDRQESPPQNETRFSRELPSTVAGRGGPV